MAGVLPGVRRRATTKRTRDGLPVHGFRTLPDNLSEVALRRFRLEGTAKAELTVMTTLTCLQAGAFELLEVNQVRNVPMMMTG